MIHIYAADVVTDTQRAYLVAGVDAYTCKVRALQAAREDGPLGPHAEVYLTHVAAFPHIERMGRSWVIAHALEAGADLTRYSTRHLPTLVADPAAPAPTTNHDYVGALDADDDGRSL